MSSPVGHALVGSLLYSVFRYTGWLKPGSKPLHGLCAGLAVVPDLDLVWVQILAVSPEIFHRTISHSLLFSLVLGLLLAWACHRLKPSLKAPALYGLFPLVLASHSILDMCCSDHFAPYGVMLFWPWTQYIYTPCLGLKSIGTFIAYNQTLAQAIANTVWLECRTIGSLYLVFAGIGWLYRANAKHQHSKPDSAI